MLGELLSNYFKPGNIGIIFGDYGTGKTTLALQAVSRLRLSGNPAILVFSGQQVARGRFAELLGFDPSGGLPKDAKVFGCGTFDAFLKLVSRMELVLDGWTEKGGDVGSPVLCVDSFTRLFLLEQGGDEKREKMSKQLNIALAWFKKMAVERALVVVLTAEERVRERGNIEEVGPAGGNLLKYWGDSFCHILRKSGAASRTLVFYENSRGGKQTVACVLGPRGFTCARGP
ncbi:MAG: hypothetical protein ACTSU5_00620 [Promethearchaeota archaeon]